MMLWLLNTLKYLHFQIPCTCQLIAQEEEEEEEEEEAVEGGSHQAGASTITISA